jgi:hypothetical protein
METKRYSNILTLHLIFLMELVVLVLYSHRWSGVDAEWDQQDLDLDGDDKLFEI